MFTADSICYLLYFVFVISTWTVMANRRQRNASTMSHAKATRRQLEVLITEYKSKTKSVREPLENFVDSHY
jgi:hypothetical protein